VGHDSYMWHFGEIEGGSVVLTICGAGRWGSRFGWEAEMNDGRQSSFGGYGVGGMAALSVPSISWIAARKGSRGDALDHDGGFSMCRLRS
jgi:hypothetical protein